MILSGRKFCQEHFRCLNIFPQNAYFERKWAKSEVGTRLSPINLFPGFLDGWGGKLFVRVLVTVEHTFPRSIQVFKFFPSRFAICLDYMTNHVPYTIRVPHFLCIFVPLLCSSHIVYSRHYRYKCDAIWENIHKVRKVNFKISIILRSGGKDKALEKPKYWHTPFSIPVVCKQGAINTI